MSSVESIDRLLEEGVIDAILGQLMSGKEASIFVVERKGEVCAAKVYKTPEERTFQATATYTEGRNQTRNSRDKRAMGKRSNYGKQLVEASWQDMEFQALSEAAAGGVRVPRPLALIENVLLMELLLDEDSAPAPRLADLALTADQAKRWHKDIYEQVRLLLQCGKIHGDLSAFNILVTPEGPTLIDFPQVIDAARNNHAAEILHRDLANVTDYCARFFAPLAAYRDCGRALWRHYRFGTLAVALEPEAGQDRQSQRPRREKEHRGEPHRQQQARPLRGTQQQNRPRPNPPPHERPNQSHPQRPNQPHHQRPHSPPVTIVRHPSAPKPPEQSPPQNTGGNSRRRRRRR